MHICLISREVDLPPDEGASVKLYYTAQSLAEAGHDVYYVSDSDHYFKVTGERWRKNSYPSLVCSLFRHLELIKKILIRLGVPDKDWILFHPLFNLNLALKLLYVAFKEEIDIFQAEFPAYQMPAAFAALVTRKKSILVEHNVETFRIEATAQLKAKGREFISRTERLAAKLAEKTITVSREDKARLMSLGVTADKIAVIPHGVDLERFKRGKREKVRSNYSLKGQRVLIFHGVMSYPPNQEAVNELESEIFPRLQQKLDRVKLLIVGKYHDPGQRGDIIYTGRVDSIEDYLKAADLAVVPLRAGGGTRLKILEYFAAGVPVVSTAKGAEGLQVTDGQQLVVAESPEEIVDSIVDLFQSPSQRKKVVNEARKFVESRDWSQIADKYEQVYRSVLAS